MGDFSDNLTIGHLKLLFGEAFFMFMRWYLGNINITRCIATIAFTKRIFGIW